MVFLLPPGVPSRAAAQGFSVHFERRATNAFEPPLSSSRTTCGEIDRRLHIFALPEFAGENVSIGRRMVGNGGGPEARDAELWTLASRTRSEIAWVRGEAGSIPLCSAVARPALARSPGIVRWTRRLTIAEDR